MNDFERQLSRQPFLAPPAELREAIFGRMEFPSSVIETTRWTWRDWFWPSPYAWGALAALWLLFAALTFADRPEPSKMTAGQSPKSSLNTTLLSYHNPSALNHAIDLAN